MSPIRATTTKAPMAYRRKSGFQESRSFKLVEHLDMRFGENSLYISNFIVSFAVRLLSFNSCRLGENSNAKRKGTEVDGATFIKASTSAPAKAKKKGTNCQGESSQQAKNPSATHSATPSGICYSSSQAAGRTHNHNINQTFSGTFCGTFAI